MKAFALWYSQTARIIGYPVLFIVLITAIEKTMFTVTCALGGYQCQYSLMATNSVNDFVGELVTGEVVKNSLKR
jgi:hypothetical protein